MPGYVIHLCVAKEYIKKHGNIKNEKDFFDGTVRPDYTTDKKITHYSSNASSETNLYNFLSDKKLDSSFNEGWFLHLLSDCLFYNKYFFGWKSMDLNLLYKDYDFLNRPLKNKYNLEYVPEGVEYYFNIDENGQTTEYHYDKVVKFIEEVSNYDLHELSEEILSRKDYKFLLK